MGRSADNRDYVKLPSTARTRAALAELRQSLSVIRPDSPVYPPGHGPSLNDLLSQAFDVVDHVLAQVDTVLEVEHFDVRIRQADPARKITPAPPALRDLTMPARRRWLRGQRA